MVGSSFLKSIIMSVIAMLTSVFIAVVGGVAVPAVAHDCGCQTDNSGSGSANSGPGNACHDNSGPGSTTSGSSGSDSGSSGSDSGSSGSDSGSSGSNSGPGDGDCPMDDGDDGDDGTDPGTDPSSSDGNSGSQAEGGSTVVAAANVATAPTQAGAQVPTVVNAGLTDSNGSPSSLPVVMMLIGLTMVLVSLSRRRARD